MRRPDLTPDCGACAALCCVATAFDTSEHFALSKPAGVRCPYLTRACRCAIHDDLVGRGFAGCAAFDCYGAGQRASRAFASDSEPTRLEAFRVLRDLHELLWLLTEARKLCPGQELSARLDAAIEALDALALGDAAALLALDLRPHREHTHALLRGVGVELGGRARWRRGLARTG